MDKLVISITEARWEKGKKEPEIRQNVRDKKYKEERLQAVIAESALQGSLEKQAISTIKEEVYEDSVLSSSPSSACKRGYRDVFGE